MILMHAELKLENHFPSLYLQVNQGAHYYYKLGVQFIVFRMLMYTYTGTEESAFGWVRWYLNLGTVIVGELDRIKLVCE